MEEEDEIRKRVDRGALTRGWILDLLKLAKRFMIPSPQKKNKRKPKALDRIPFQDGIINMIVASHVDFSNILSNERLETVPIRMPWKVLEAVSIPSVAQLLMHGSASMVSRMETHPGTTTSDHDENGLGVKMLNNFPDYKDRIQRYRLNSAASERVSQSNVTTISEKAEHGPVTRSRMRHMSRPNQQYLTRKSLTLASVTWTPTLANDSRDGGARLADTEMMKLNGYSATDSGHKPRDSENKTENTTADVSVQTSALIRQIVRTQIPRLQRTDSSVQSDLPGSRTAETQCVAMTSEASIQATCESPMREVGTQVGGEMVDASTQPLSIDTGTISVQTQLEKTDGATLAVCFVSTATTGTQTCETVSADFASQCKIHFANASVQIFPSTQIVSSQTEAGVEDNSQLAKRIARMVKKYATKAITQCQNESETVDKLEEEVLWFLSRMRDLYGLPQENSDIIIAGARRIADEQGSIDTRGDTSSYDKFPKLRSTTDGTQTSVNAEGIVYGIGIQSESLPYDDRMVVDMCAQSESYSAIPETTLAAVLSDDTTHHKNSKTGHISSENELLPKTGQIKLATDTDEHHGTVDEVDECQTESQLCKYSEESITSYAGELADNVNRKSQQMGLERTGMSTLVKSGRPGELAEYLRGPTRSLPVTEYKLWVNSASSFPTPYLGYRPSFTMLLARNTKEFQTGNYFPRKSLSKPLTNQPVKYKENWLETLSLSVLLTGKSQATFGKFALQKFPNDLVPEERRRIANFNHSIHASQSESVVTEMIHGKCFTLPSHSLPSTLNHLGAVKGLYDLSVLTRSIGLSPNEVTTQAEADKDDQNSDMQTKTRTRSPVYQLCIDFIDHHPTVHAPLESISGSHAENHSLDSESMTIEIDLDTTSFPPRIVLPNKRPNQPTYRGEQVAVNENTSRKLGTFDLSPGSGFLWNERLVREFRTTSTSPSVSQTGTFSPDTTSMDADSMTIDINLGASCSPSRLAVAVTERKCKNLGTFDLPPGSDFLWKERLVLESRGTSTSLTASQTGTFSPDTPEIEDNEDGDYWIVAEVRTVRDDNGWLLPDVDVPIVDKDCIEFKHEKDGVTRIVLGTGSFGSVEAARYRKGDDSIVDVAVKVFNNRSCHANIIREAKLLQYLHDAQVFPQFYGFADFGVGDETNICLVMEMFAKGTTLADLVFAGVDCLEPNEWMSICLQLAKCLQKIHRKNVIYNDVKEDNILVDYSCYGRPVVKYIDVGISTYMHGIKYNYSEEEMANFPHIAPEVNRSRTSFLSDIYGLGKLYWKISQITTIPDLMNVAEACTTMEPKDRMHLDAVIICLVAIGQREMLI